MKPHMIYPRWSEHRFRLGVRAVFARLFCAELVGNDWEGLRKKWLGVFAAICCGFAGISLMAGCNNTNAANSGLQTPLIAVAMVQYPPSLIITGSTVPVSATVTNDPANAGVDWVATCASAPNCGTFTPSHTASGTATLYTAPTAVPTKAAVSIVALSTTDKSKSSAASVTIQSTVTSVVISPSLPASAPAGSVLKLSATVTGDPANLGVDWTVFCPTVNGTVACSSGLHSPVGGTATFVVPQQVLIPGTAQTQSLLGSNIFVTAYATADHTYSASSPLLVTAPVTINITQPPPTNMAANATAPLIAVVSNAPASTTVTWSVFCLQASCGTVVPNQTASGAAAIFTAPPIPDQTVQITATANIPGQDLFTTVNVNITTAPPTPNSLLQGQFVLYLSASNSQNGRYILGGVISGDGNGNVTSGNFDLADAAGNAVSAFGLPVVSPSTYSLGSDGRGQIQLTLSRANLKTSFGVPVSATDCSLTLSVAFVSSQHALVTETDTFGNATGTLDLQNASDLGYFTNGSEGLNGTYSLQLTGAGLVNPYPGFYVAAAIASQASGTVYSFTGYTADQSNNGVITSVPFTSGSQSFANSAPNSQGEIQLGSINLGLQNPFSLDLWLIDANHFVVTDLTDATAAAPILVGGYLTIQPTYYPLAGTFAFTESGATAAGQQQVAGGILSCGSTGTLDVAPLAGTGLYNQSINASCSGATNGRGTISLTGTGAGNSGITLFAAYPTADRGLYLIELDGGAAGTSGPSGTGVAYLQNLAAPISSSAMDGNYASIFTANTALGSQSFTSQIVADGVSFLSGTADVNSFDTAAPPLATPSPGASLAGYFTTFGNGRFLLTLTLTPATGQPNPQVSVFHPTCYIVDAGSCLLLGIDASAPGMGIIQLQNTGL